MRTEREKMLNGELYMACDEELLTQRTKVRTLTRKYNNEPNPEILEYIFGYKLDNVYIEPPFYCDYGVNIELGKNVYMNFNCTILDCAKVKIGENTFLAPNVQIYCATHPIDAETRTGGLEYAKPITIGKNCWIGGGAILLPGVEIGDNCVIGAGSVVTRNIATNSVAVGNPCKIIRKV